MLREKYTYNEMMCCRMINSRAYCVAGVFACTSEHL